jgi:hypothetical protein
MQYPLTTNGNRQSGVKVLFDGEKKFGACAVNRDPNMRRHYSFVMLCLTYEYELSHCISILDICHSILTSKQACFAPAFARYHAL